MEGKKKRMFQLTLNQIEKWELLLEYLKSLGSLKYLIAAKEIAPLPPFKKDVVGIQETPILIQYSCTILISFLVSVSYWFNATTNGIP